MHSCGREKELVFTETFIRNFNTPYYHIGIRNLTFLKGGNHVTLKFFNMPE